MASENKYDSLSSGISELCNFEHLNAEQALIQLQIKGKKYMADGKDGCFHGT